MYTYNGNVAENSEGKGWLLDGGRTSTIPHSRGRHTGQPFSKTVWIHHCNIKLRLTSLIKYRVNTCIYINMCIYTCVSCWIEKHTYTQTWRHQKNDSPYPSYPSMSHIIPSNSEDINLKWLLPRRPIAFMQGRQGKCEASCVGAWRLQQPRSNNWQSTSGAWTPLEEWRLSPELVAYM